MWTHHDGDNSVLCLDDVFSQPRCRKIREIGRSNYQTTKSNSEFSFRFAFKFLFLAQFGLHLFLASVRVATSSTLFSFFLFLRILVKRTFSLSLSLPRLPFLLFSTHSMPTEHSQPSLRERQVQ